MKFSGRLSIFFMLLASVTAAPQYEPIRAQQTDTTGALLKRVPPLKDDGNGPGKGIGNGNGEGNGDPKDPTPPGNAAHPPEVVTPPGPPGNVAHPPEIVTPPGPPGKAATSIGITTTLGEKAPELASPTKGPIPDSPNGPIDAVILPPSEAVSYPAYLSTYSSIITTASTTSSSASSVVPAPSTTSILNGVGSSSTAVEPPSPSSDPSSSSAPTPKRNTLPIVAATMGFLSLILILSFLGFSIWRKKTRRKRAGDKEWDMATKEKQPDIPPPDLALPSPAYAPTLPSRVFRNTFRSSHVPSSHRIDEVDEPDEIMHIPPVEASHVLPVDLLPSPIFALPRPRHSSTNFNILYSSEPMTTIRPTSFGSYNNEDPFADRPPIKSPTLGSFGPGQGGTGVGVKTSTNQ